MFQSEFGFRYDDDVRLWTIDLDQARALENLISKHALDAPERNVLHGVNDGPAADKALTGLASRSPKQESLLQDIKKSKGSNFTNGVIALLAARQPKFFFTSHFERMSGMVSIEKHQQDMQSGAVSVGDKIFLDFLEYAGTTLEDMKNVDRREELKAKCESLASKAEIV